MARFGTFWQLTPSFSTKVQAKKVLLPDCNIKWVLLGRNFRKRQDILNKKYFFIYDFRPCLFSFPPFNIFCTTADLFLLTMSDGNNHIHQEGPLSSLNIFCTTFFFLTSYELSDGLISRTFCRRSEIGREIFCHHL